MIDANGKFFLTKYDIIADMHTHTIFSQHAFSTLQENLAAAHAASLKYMVTSDHYYNEGTDIQRKNETNRIFYVSQRANPNQFGVQLIGSVECNLEQKMDESLVKKLRANEIKYRPIGLHSWFLPREIRTCDEIFADFAKAHEDYNFNVFCHIEREMDKINHGKYGMTMHKDLEEFFAKMVKYAKDNGVLLEVNEASLSQDNCGNRERMKYWLTLAKENGNHIVLGSDAHYSAEVGRFDNVIEMINEVGYPEKLILNCNEDQIKKMFGF